MAVLVILFMVLTAATGIAGWVFLAAAIWAAIQKTGGVRERVVTAFVMWFLSAGLIVLMVFFGAQAVDETENVEVAEEVLDDGSLIEEEPVEKQEGLLSDRPAEELRPMAQEVDYLVLKKNPDAYAGQVLMYEGEILQILEGDDYSEIRIVVEEDEEWGGYNYDSLIYYTIDANTTFVEGDIVTFFGVVQGSYEYESIAGWQMSVPWIHGGAVE